jgi:uncharacterized protein with GYD domain
MVERVNPLPVIE